MGHQMPSLLLFPVAFPHLLRQVARSITLRPRCPRRRCLTWALELDLIWGSQSKNGYRYLISKCTYACMYVCRHILIHANNKLIISIYPYTYACTYSHTHIYIHIFTYTYLHSYIYIHIHIISNLSLLNLDSCWFHMSRERTMERTM